MFFLIVCGIALVVAFAPLRISTFGRIMAISSAALNYSYGIGVLNGRASLAFGSLGQYPNFTPASLGVEVATSLATLALALFISPMPKGTIARRSEPMQIKIPPLVSYTVLALSMTSSLYLLTVLDLGNLISYDGYGSVKNLNAIFAGNPIGKFFGSSMKIFIVLSIALAIFAYHQGRLGYFLISCVPITIGVIIGLAEAGRIVSLYWGVAAVTLFVLQRRGLATVFALLALASVAYALEARSNYTLGLAYVVDYFVESLSNDALFDQMLSNVSAGLLVTSASAKVSIAGNYDEWFKTLSFLPTIDFIDGFQAAKEANEQRVNWYIPFNSPGEAWAFGPAYFALYWAIVFTAAHYVNKAMALGRVHFITLLSIFLIAYAYSTQYPIRNCMRYFYAIIVTYYLFVAYRRWRGRRSEAADLVRAEGLRA